MVNITSKVLKNTLIYFVYVINILFVLYVFEKNFLNGNIDYILPTRIPKPLSRLLLLMSVLIGSIILVLVNSKINISQLNDKYILVTLFITATLLSLPLIFFSEIMPNSDFLTYYLIAKNLLNGKIFIPNYIAVFPHTIAFSTFLSFVFRLFGPSILSAQLTGIVLSSLSVVFVYLIGQEVSKKQYGFIAALIWTLMPSRIFYSILICTENLFNAIALLSALIFLKAMNNTLPIKNKYLNFVLIGVLFAILNSIRPNGIIVFIAFIVFYLLFFEYKSDRENVFFFFKIHLKKGLIVKSFFVLTVFIAYFLTSFSINLAIESKIKQQIATPRIGWNMYVGLNVSSHGQWNKKDSELFSKLIQEKGPQQVQKTFFELGIKRLQDIIKDKKMKRFILDKVITMWHADHESYDYAAGAQPKNSRAKLKFSQNNKAAKLIFDTYYYIVLFTSLLELIMLTIKRGGLKPVILIGCFIILGTILLHIPFEVALRYKNHALLWFCFISANGIVTISEKITISSKLNVNN
ncbi:MULTISPECIES: ArnT family glycosyltransferase [unclassified Caldicellulosiruptor]|uniref:ArnT family glycosyltransferase n=1 Tax=unclassified Caldicellulosiruptor TaxID=2622462 RepID=UPI0003AA243B|nr:MULTISPECIES: glycosyltransferase family 39 protein [unclassified Caldicellulosiruptor]